MREKWLTFADFLAQHFQGKVQKLAVNAGFSCPNRDGTIGTGGCIYCNNQAFVPRYCQPGMSVTEQIERGKQFFARKYPQMRYLAYFQAYTSTYGSSSDVLMQLYREACSADDVVGVIIGTRPDCVDSDLLRCMAQELPWAMLEYGAETSHDTTLQLINRGHTWSQVVKAVEMTAREGLHVGLHLIMGLPGETRAMMLQTIDRINDLPVDVLKIHRLQVLHGTRLEQELAQGKYDIMRGSAEDYATLCREIISRLRPTIAIDRFLSASPPEMVVYPRWGLKNYQFAHLLTSKE